MAGKHLSILIHFVWSTAGRERWIGNDWRERYLPTWAVSSGIRTENCLRPVECTIIFIFTHHFLQPFRSLTSSTGQIKFVTVGS